MHYSAAIIVLFAASGLATPIAQADTNPTSTTATTTATSPADLTTTTATIATSTAADSGKKKHHCSVGSVIRCAASLGPVGVECVASALQEGLDPLTDIPCLTGILGDIANPPQSCLDCI